jgi:hypothetical protein
VASDGLRDLKATDPPRFFSLAVSGASPEKQMFRALAGDGDPRFRAGVATIGAQAVTVREAGHPLSPAFAGREGQPASDDPVGQQDFHVCGDGFVNRLGGHARNVFGGRSVAAVR